MGFFSKSTKSNVVEKPKNHTHATLRIAGIPCSPQVETGHLLLAGTIGTGKSQLIHHCLNRVLWGCDQRGEKAIITDSGGHYLESRGRANDKTLNPFDSRDAGWNPFLEIREPSDFAMVAAAAIVDEPSSSPEWTNYARDLLADVLKHLHANGQYDPLEALRLVLKVPAKELFPVLIGTSSEILVQKGSEKILQSVRFSAARSLRTWEFLSPDGKFSIRDWIDNGSGPCFITYRDSQIDVVRNMISAWLSIAVKQTLSLSPDFERRVWFIMDELDSLGRIHALSDSLPRGRKYGLCTIGAIHSIAQLRERYGKEGAQTLLSTFSSKIVLRQGSAEDAEYWSREIGQREVWRESHGRSERADDVSESSNQSVAVESAVLPSELMRLPERTGYALLRDRPEILSFKFDVIPWPPKIPAFIPKTVEPTPPTMEDHISEFKKEFSEFLQTVVENRKKEGEPEEEVSENDQNID